MDDRSRKLYTPDWVRQAIDGEVHGPDASAVQSLAQSIGNGRSGESLVPRISEAMNAWVESDQSGDLDRPDCWPDFTQVAAKSLEPESDSHVLDAPGRGSDGDTGAVAGSR
jgi:hypothetical protein